MLPEEFDMHLRAGQFFGELPTCGKKIDYRSELSAKAAAIKMSQKSGRDLEHYPCYWCSGWHIGRSLSEKERIIFSDREKSSTFGTGEIININVAEPVFGVQLGVKPLRVHSRYICEGEYCSVHSPSDHPLKYALLNWRGDLRIMERLCEHGIGHPDPDDITFRRIRDGKNFIDYSIGHDCDNCCIGGTVGII